MRSSISLAETDAIEQPTDLLDHTVLWSGRQKPSTVIGLRLIGLSFFILLIITLAIAALNPVDVDLAFLAALLIPVVVILTYLKNLRSGASSEYRLIENYWLEMTDDIVRVWPLADFQSATLTAAGGNDAELSFYREDDLDSPLPAYLESPDIATLAEAFHTCGLQLKIPSSLAGATKNSPTNTSKLWSRRRGIPSLGKSSLIILASAALPVSILAYLIFQIWTPIPDSYLRLIVALFQTIFTMAICGLSVIAVIFVFRGVVLDRAIDVLGKMEISKQSIDFLWPISGKVRRSISPAAVSDAYLVEATSRHGWLALVICVNKKSGECVTLDLFGVPDYDNALRYIREAARL